jgi:hypothetical protein
MAEVSTQDSNKAIVQASFDRWKSGNGSPFELLVPDAEWTIVGSSLRPIAAERNFSTKWAARSMPECRSRRFERSVLRPPEPLERPTPRWQAVRKTVPSHAMARLRQVLCSILLFHIADDGLPAIMDMHMLDAHKLLSAMTQASKDLYLGASPHQTSRRRTKGRNSLRRRERDI